MKKLNVSDSRCNIERVENASINEDSNKFSIEDLLKINRDIESRLFKFGIYPEVGDRFQPKGVYGKKEKLIYIEFTEIIWCGVEELELGIRIHSYDSFRNIY